MAKGEIKIKKNRKKKEEVVSFEPRMSSDKKTFVLVVESTCRATFGEFLLAVMDYAQDEFEKLGPGDDLNPH